MQGLLTRNPRDRLTAAKALDHPWVREGGEASEEPLALGNTLVRRCPCSSFMWNVGQCLVQHMWILGRAWISSWC